MLYSLLCRYHWVLKCWLAIGPPSVISVAVVDRDATQRANGVCEV